MNGILTFENDDYLVFWESHGQEPIITSNQGIMAQVFDVNDAPVTPPFLVNSDFTLYQNDASACKLENSKFLIVWVGLSGLRGQIFNNDYSFYGTEFKVSGTSADHENPACEGMEDGGFVIVSPEADELQLFAYDSSYKQIVSKMVVDDEILGYA